MAHRPAAQQRLQLCLPACVRVSLYGVKGFIWILPMAVMLS
jgi:hypothetical protein